MYRFLQIKDLNHIVIKNFTCCLLIGSFMGQLHLKYTHPPVQDSGVVLTGECDFEMDWHILLEFNTPNVLHFSWILQQGDLI